MTALLSEWVQSLFCDKYGWQTHTPSNGDAHHIWLCGNNVVAHCLYTGKQCCHWKFKRQTHSGTQWLFGETGTLYILGSRTVKTKDSPDTTDGRQNLDEHSVTSMCKNVATKHIACLTVLWVLHKQHFILSHLQWVKGIYVKGQSFVWDCYSSVLVVLTLSLMLCRAAAGLTCDTIMNFHNQY